MAKAYHLVYARAVDVGEATRPVLYHRSRAGTTEPLVAWGKREGRRKVALGWDWIGNAHDIHLALPTVWQHALNWLSPEEEARPGALWAGEPFPVPRATTQPAIPTATVSVTTWINVQALTTTPTPTVTDGCHVCQGNDTTGDADSDSGCDDVDVCQGR